MKRFILEACVDSVDSALAASRGGADRLELCSSLVIGGTTPDVHVLNQIRRKSDIKINVLIRPRFGDFCYTDEEFELMLVQVKRFVNTEVNGIVSGILKPDGNLDVIRMAKLITAAGGLDITLHRAFDQSKDPYKTLEDSIDLGIKTILTSGQKADSIQGMSVLGDMAAAADDRIEIMAGGGIDASVIKQIQLKTKIRSFHMSGKKIINSPMVWRNPDVKMGLPTMSEYEIWQTDEAEIKKARNIIDSFV